MTSGGHNPRIRRRALGPTVGLLLDLLSNARASRNWLVVVIVVIAAVAAVAAFVGQTVVPWAIYPAL